MQHDAKQYSQYFFFYEGLQGYYNEKTYRHALTGSQEDRHVIETLKIITLGPGI